MSNENYKENTMILVLQLLILCLQIGSLGYAFGAKKRPIEVMYGLPVWGCIPMVALAFMTGA